MVLATQTLLQRDPKTYEVRVDGRLAPGVSAKDIILALIARIGIGGGTGHVFEYRGEAIRALTMEQRMTICNMASRAAPGPGSSPPTTRPSSTSTAARTRRRAPRGTRPSPAGARCRPTTARRSTGRSRSTRSPRADGHLRHEPGHGHADHVARPVPRRRGRPAPRGARSSTRSSTWTSSRASRSSARRWTSSSSARAPTAGSATCAWPPPRSRTATSLTACG